jgi:hypothetical protein
MISTILCTLEKVAGNPRFFPTHNCTMEMEHRTYMETKKFANANNVCRFLHMVDRRLRLLSLAFRLNFDKDKWIIF